MKKTLKSIVLSLAIAVNALGVCAVDAAAAAPRFTGDYFGAGFDCHESDKMEIADGWSNGGMFDCTWSKNNVSFNDGKMNLSILGNSWSGYTGAEIGRAHV